MTRHSIGVNHWTVTRPGDTTAVAWCVCGWSAPRRHTKAEADADAECHRFEVDA